MIEYKTNIPKFSLKKEPSDYKKVKIGSSRDIFEYVKPFYKDSIDIYESMFLVLLNRSLNTIGYAKTGQGGINATISDVRILAKFAIESLASAAIIVHNHPSESILPSDNDDSLTKKVKEVFKLIDVNLTDHLIITKTRYYSYADEGKL